MKKTTILTLLFLTFHKVFSAEQCYACLEKCDDPLKIQTCRHEDLSENLKIKCYTIEIISAGVNVIDKGCIPAELADAECANVDQVSGTKCFICDGDLCNGSNHGRGGGGSGAGETVLFLGLVGLWAVPYFVR